MQGASTNGMFCTVVYKIDCFMYDRSLQSSFHVNILLLQDLSAFSKDEFDPKDWINKTFQCPEAQADKEV